MCPMSVLIMFKDEDHSSEKSKAYSNSGPCVGKCPSKYSCSGNTSTSTTSTKQEETNKRDCVGVSEQNQ